MNYTQTHLFIGRDDLRANSSNDLGNFQVLETLPKLSRYSDLFNRVGSPWDWHRRPLYQDLNERLNGARLFELRNEAKTVGFALTNANRNLSKFFNDKAVTEIENFGLFPEHTGKNLGKVFLPMLFDRLFETADVVYLSTRSTNHPGVVKFYQDCGMRVLAREEKPNDLLPPPALAANF